MTASVNLIRACRELREAKAKLYELRQAQSMAFQNVSRSIDSLCAVAEPMPLPPAKIEREDVTKAIREKLLELIDGPLSHYTAAEDRLDEIIDEECERLGLDPWAVKNNLRQADHFRERIQIAIKEARRWGWADKPNRYASNSSPLYGMRSDLRFYREWMRLALRPADRRRAA